MNLIWENTSFLADVAICPILKNIMSTAECRLLDYGHHLSLFELPKGLLQPEHPRWNSCAGCVLGFWAPESENVNRWLTQLQIWHVDLTNGGFKYQWDFKPLNMDITCSIDSVGSQKFPHAICQLVHITSHEAFPVAFWVWKKWSYCSPEELLRSNHRSQVVISSC